MPRKTKQLNIDDKIFTNTNGTKTRIELLPNGKLVPYKKELWKKYRQLLIIMTHQKGI